MVMSTGYRNAIANYGGGLITHIALVNSTGGELTGGEPSYARQVVTWTTASSGIIRPATDLVFNVPSSVTVGGWRGFSALTSGIDYGGADLANETYTNQGEYTLLAVNTGILHNDST